MPLSGDELVVFAVESLTLDLDPTTPESASAMVLDHLVTLEAVTPGQRGQFRFWFTGGNAADARPEIVNGVQSLDIGDAVNDSVSYRIGSAVFVGDSMFMPDFGTGRTNVPGGDVRTLGRSIEKIVLLPDELILCMPYQQVTRSR